MTISVQAVNVIEQIATAYTKPGQTAATIKDTVQAANSDSKTQTQTTVNAGVSAAQLASALATTMGKSIPGAGFVAPISLVNNTQQIAKQLSDGQPVDASLVPEQVKIVVA